MKLVQEMEQTGILANEDTYTHLIQVACRKSLHTRATDLVSLYSHMMYTHIITIIHVVRGNENKEYSHTVLTLGTHRHGRIHTHAYSLLASLSVSSVL